MTTDLMLLAIQNISMALLVGHCLPIRRIAFQFLRLCHDLLVGVDISDSSGITDEKRKCLIGSMYGETIMVISPLLKWYVQHGLKVTKIHQVVEYTPATCF
jgi:hypothetical protein